MRDINLVNALREHAEWAEANEWETPITLSDDLVKAADRIEAQAKEIEKLRGQLPRWIPVEEHLPENGVPVLRYFSQCQRCGAGAKRGHTKEDAVKERNRRADERV